MSVCKECDSIGYHKAWCSRMKAPELIEAKADECAIAEMSEESKAMFRQRKADQSDLISWILHYKNPADDETKLRQIRLVVE